MKVIEFFEGIDGSAQMIVHSRRYGYVLVEKRKRHIVMPYTWYDGLIARIKPGDTLDALNNGAWNAYGSHITAIRSGADDDRPLLDWTPEAIERIARAALHGV